MTEEPFTLVGIRPEQTPAPAARGKTEIPVGSMAVLALIVLGCVFAGAIARKDPSYLDLANYAKAPGREFLFGTDTLGRDMFACIWYGGRVSLSIGFLATAISTAIAVVFGAVSGLASDRADTLLMRLTEVLLSVPELLLVLFLQAVWGQPSVWSISVIIGLTSWFSIAKVVRTEVRQLRASEYVVASRCMGGSFWHILTRHLAPNFLSAIMFMVVMNIRGAIVAESTLSFLGMGLPLDVISWGSMLSLSERALMTKAWWMIWIPGAFLVTLFICLTNVGNWLRKSANRKESSL